MKPSIKRLAQKLISPKLRRIFSPYWYRGAVGGLWDEMGKLQFNFLKEKGLKPEHYLLDVGCGSLRGGIYFVDYLDQGRYFGIDINKEFLKAGKKELKKKGILNKNATLIQMDSFNFQSLTQMFDYALAQSVFTHIHLNSIIKCLMNIEKVLVPGGKFYVTFFENSKGKFNLGPIMHPRKDGGSLVSNFDKDNYHYDLETFKWICKGTKLRVEYIGNWNHPRDQKMLVFIKS